MRYPITPAAIRLAVPRHADPTAAAAALDAACARYGVTTRASVAMLIAQLAHESQIMPISENLWYTASRIQQVWPSRFPTVRSADPYAQNPQALANKVYGGRMGNTGRNDGWMYRGRSYIQVTGRDMYRAIGQAIGLDLEGNPDLLLTHKASALAALEVCKRKGLLTLLGSGDVQAVTRAINGGYNGLADRQALYGRLIRALPPEQTHSASVSSVFLTHAGEPPRRELWDGKPGSVYGGHALDVGFFERLRTLYPKPGTYPHGGVSVTVAEDGALILTRT